MGPLEVDAEVRQRTFQFLDGLREVHGNTLPFSALSRGFDFRGVRVPLVSQQGIFKPAVLQSMPLSMRTTPDNPNKPRQYDDSMGEGGTIRYKYRRTNPAHRDNASLREAMRRQVPLVYFF